MPSETEILKKALLESGKILRRNFLHVSYLLKARGNLLTKADLASQKSILGLITKNFPEHDYLAEENAKKSTGSEFLWIIDPLDGTTNYAHGFPVSSITIGLMRAGKPFAGGIYDPFRDELFLAQKDRGATLNGKKIHVSAVKKLEDSLLTTGFPYNRNKDPEFFLGFFSEFLARCHDIRRNGSAALDLAWVAAGRVDGYWEFELNPWDVSAGRLLVEEAGGKVTDFKGKAWGKVSDFGQETLAGNQDIHPIMLNMILKQMKKRPYLARKKPRC